MADPRYRGTYLAIRKAWAPVVARGEADCHEPICLMPNRRLQPGAKWDLSHGPDGSILGPSHPFATGLRGENAAAPLRPIDSYGSNRVHTQPGPARSVQVPGSGPDSPGFYKGRP